MARWECRWKYKKRTGYIMVRGFKKLILLSRTGKLEAPYMTEFDSNGGTTTITIQSNIEWKITIN